MAPDGSKTPRHQLPVKQQHYYGGGWHPSVSGAEMPAVPRPANRLAA
jgi:hypothetical protein